MQFFAKAICRFSHVVYCSWACFVLVTSCLPAGKMYLLTFYRWDCQHQMNRRNKMSLKSKILWIEGHIHQSAVLLWRSNSLISTVQFTLWHNPVRPKPHPIHTLTQSSSLYATSNSHNAISLSLNAALDFHDPPLRCALFDSPNLTSVFLHLISDSQIL